MASTLGLHTVVTLAAVATSLVADCDGCSLETDEADAVETGGIGTVVVVVLVANVVLDLAAIVGAGFVLGVATGAGLVLDIVGTGLLLVVGVVAGLALGVGAVLVFGMVKAGGGATVDGGGTNGCWPAIADLPLAVGGVCFLVVVGAAAAAALAAAAAASAARVSRGVIGASLSASNTEFEPVSE